MITIKNDFQWIDSTVTGMGRPGNLKTEDILGKTNNYLLTREFKKSKLYFNDLKIFINRIQINIINLKKKYTNLYSKYLDKRYSSKEYKKILLSLAKVNTKSLMLIDYLIRYILTKKIKVSGHLEIL